MFIKRFSVIDRLFHLLTMLTFFTQAVTGFGRLYATTAWGGKLCGLFGGYEKASLIHRWVGVLMVVGFLVHIAYILSQAGRTNIREIFLGPDSLVPTLRDLRHLGQRVRWTLGRGASPELDRWSYWEKFDYWAVFWGLPLLAVTGLMMMYPLETCRILPGWSLNVAAFVHKAESILAVTYIFAVHYFIVHFRPGIFPLNETMFSGYMKLEHALREKPAWIGRLEGNGEMELMAAGSPALIWRIAYFVFGYAALAVGLYLLINCMILAPYVELH